MTKQKKRYIITPTLYDGAIAIHGWKETASMPVGDFFTQLFKQVPQVSAGLAASIFHFGELSIADLKKELAENDIEVRI